MLRRDFLERLTLGLAFGGFARTGFAQKARTPTTVTHPHWIDSATLKLERIAISTWSLHNYFRVTRDKNFHLPGPMLALLDFPDLAVDRYKLRHFEFCATHFGSLEPAYLQEMKYALVRTRSTIVNIVLDIEECGPEGTFSDPDPEHRSAALDAVKRWIDIAQTLGARSVRVGPGKLDVENLTPTVESYKALGTYALAKGVRVNVENHSGCGADHPEELVKLIKLVGPARLSALPDFGNFPDEVTREKGLKMFFPYAQTICHASGLEFGADGAETQYNFSKVMEIARKSDYRGVYSIEFEGPGDPYAGIQKTLDELVKYL
jgi:hypothetical protein